MDNDIRGLLDTINEAAISPDLWQEVAFGIKEFCPGGGVSFMFYDRVTSELPWEIGTYEAERKKRYEAYYTKINSVWPVMQQQKLGTVADTDFFDIPNRIGHTEFYNDFMLPYGVGFLRGGIMASGADAIGACVVSYDHKINRRHTEPSTKILETVLPDIKRSFDLSRKYAHRHYGLKTMEARVDQFKDPAFIIRTDGTIDYMNSTGEAALKQERGIKKMKGAHKLILSDAPSQARYAQLLKQTLGRQNGRYQVSDVLSSPLPASTGEVPFLVRGEQGINSLSIIPIALQHASPNALFKVYEKDYATKAIVVLQYYQDNMARLKPLFKTRFGLTSKEAEFALATMEGYSHEEYEHSFGSKVGTTKKHLGQVYQKTGVHEKGKLVSLLHYHKRSFDLKEDFD